MRSRKTGMYAALLAVLLALGSCGGGGGGDTETTAPSDSTTDISTSTEEERLEIPDGVDYGGYTFRILTRPGMRLDEVYAEEADGDILSDSVFKRNREVEEMLGLRLEFIRSSSDSETDGLNPILAGEDEYDAISTSGRQSFVYAESRAVMNLFDVPYLSLDKSWWNRDIVDNLSIEDKLYCVAGDISYATLDSSFGIIFNKKLFDDYSLEYPYEMVLDGKWVYDKFETYARSIGQDLNGDGKMDIADDLFGYGAHMWMGGVEALYSTGSRVVTTDSDGYPRLSLYNERVVDMYDRYTSLVRSSECCHLQPMGDDYLRAFCAGRVGMADTNIRSMIEGHFRDAEVDYGFVPFPKYDESVDKYYSFVDAGHSLWIIPVTVSDAERSGVTLETMAYLGQKYIIPAYYDITLQKKYMRDEMSIEMLGIVKDGATFDLGYYDSAQFGGQLTNPGADVLSNKNMTITSLYTKYEQSVNTLIDKSMEAYIGE